MENTKILDILKSIQPQTSKVQQRIISFILTYTEEFIQLPITEVAKKISVDASSVSRLCAKIDLKNISELKILLAQDIVKRDKKEYHKDDLPVDLGQSAPEIVKNILNYERQHLKLLENTLKTQSLIEAQKLFHKARHVYIFGTGASSVVGLDLSQKLYRLGKCCFWSMDVDTQLMASQTVTKEDLAFCISYSGSTQYVCSIAQSTKENGIPVVALYAKEYSPLSKLADVKILTPFSDPQKHIGADVSRIHHLIVVDLICALLVAADADSSLESLQKTKEIVKKIGIR